MAAPVSTSTPHSEAKADRKARRGGEPSRIEVLVDEFCERGMDARTADELAHHVAQYHPLARTLGVASLTRDIAARGLAPDPAREVATLLLGVELMDRGASYQTVVRHMKRQPISAGEALAGALEASRIHRLAAPERVDSGAFFTYMAAGVSAVTVAMILLVVLINLAQ